MVDLQLATTWQMRVFRWGLTLLTVAVVSVIVHDWWDLRLQLHRYARQDTLGSYSNFVIVHTNSSLQTHLFLAAVVALGVLQIAIVWAWQARLAVHWWIPLVAEVLLCTSLGFAAAFAARHYAVDCTGGEGTCGVVVHTLHYAWLAVWAGAGVLIGVLWTLCQRTARATEIPDQHSTAFVRGSLA
jgi:hypothetical protein